MSHLHTPMYFFLSNLSLSDLLLSTDIIPNMLHIMLAEESSIPVTNCIFQYYVFGSLAATECLLLTMMSYDRYLAICNPLRYSSIMDIHLCLGLIVFSWIVGFLPTLPVAICVYKLKFCSPNIDHFFCDLAPFLELACSDTSMAHLLALVFSVFVTFCPFLCIIVSYAFIIYRILRIHSDTRQKTFSTCSSHLTVVSMYYGSLIIIYVAPSKERSVNLKKFLSLLYTAVTPLLNPIIYSLKNQEMSKAFGKISTMFS
ncbi:olfactory receptor 11A1-like [Pelobates fuscus]|uniref:olfactory receptor 11A1-like n=1 Tax=Pelobates fuscus TaxID=191477 RepID=UPI002FE4F299